MDNDHNPSSKKWLPCKATDLVRALAGFISADGDRPVAIGIPSSERLILFDLDVVAIDTDNGPVIALECLGQRVWADLSDRTDKAAPESPSPQGDSGAAR